MRKLSKGLTVFAAILPLLVIAAEAQNSDPYSQNISEREERRQGGEAQHRQYGGGQSYHQQPYGQSYHQQPYGQYNQNRSDDYRNQQDWDRNRWNNNRYPNYNYGQGGYYQGGGSVIVNPGNVVNPAVVPYDNQAPVYNVNTPQDSYDTNGNYSYDSYNGQ